MDLKSKLVYIEVHTGPTELLECKRELERDTENKGSGKLEDVDFTNK